MYIEMWDRKFHFNVFFFNIINLWGYTIDMIVQLKLFNNELNECEY